MDMEELNKEDTNVILLKDFVKPSIEVFQTTEDDYNDCQSIDEEIVERLENIDNNLYEFAEGFCVFDETIQKSINKFNHSLIQLTKQQAVNNSKLECVMKMLTEHGIKDLNLSTTEKEKIQ